MANISGEIDINIEVNPGHISFEDNEIGELMDYIFECHFQELSKKIKKWNRIGIIKKLLHTQKQMEKGEFFWFLVGDRIHRHFEIQGKASLPKETYSEILNDLTNELYQEKLSKQEE